ncbi:MAG: hypothetical protein AAGH15_21215 [Myxococcota bacterium]
MAKTLRTLLLATFLFAGPTAVTVLSTPSVAQADDAGSWWRRARRARRAARRASASRAVPEMSPNVAGSAGALLIGGALLVASGRRRRSDELA